MTQVSLKYLTKTYARSLQPSVSRFSMDIDSGELVTLLGPSGCGKTTILKMIAGIEAPDSGDIVFDDQVVTLVKPEERGAVMVFQNHQLFPSMTVADNIGFGLKMRGAPGSQIVAKVQGMMEMVHLTGLERYRPKQLSGGQQQRVALARALIVEPRVLLLDEPLSSLDAHLRDEMRELISSIQSKLGITTLLVTHDREEAVVIADRIALFTDGQLQQLDKPINFYQRPANETAARYFGGENFFVGEVVDCTFKCKLGQLQVADHIPNGPCTLTIRPENIRLSTSPSDMTNVLTAHLVEKKFHGTHVKVKLAIAEELIVAHLNLEDVEQQQTGETLMVSLPPNAFSRV